MRNISKLTLALLGASTLAVAPAAAQPFGGFRIEGDLGYSRFSSEGISDSKFSWGGQVGYDFAMGGLIVGPSVEYWHGREENCQVITTGTAPNTVARDVCRKSFQEWSGNLRAGVLLSPSTLVYGKVGYVDNEQRKYVTGPAGYYDKWNARGLGIGGGIEQAFGNMYANLEYKYSDYNHNSHKQRVMLGLGMRFGASAPVIVEETPVVVEQPVVETPATQTCPDNSVILATETCPAPAPVQQPVAQPERG